MPAIRKCGQCGEQAMISSMGIFKASRPYQCQNCKAEIKLTPLAMLGMQLSIFVFLSLGGLLFVIYFAQEAKTLLSLLGAFSFWLFLSAAVFWVIYMKLKDHKQNPIADDDVRLSENNVSNPRIKQEDSWIEGKSFLFGLLSPIIFVMAVTGLIALLVFIDSVFV